MRVDHRVVLPCLCALALTACAHDRTSPHRVAGAFDSALDAVKTGEVSTAQAGEFVVQRTEDASVGVWRGTRQQARAGRKDVPDPSIETKVKNRYAVSKKVDADDIDVQVQNGVVTLSGNVASAHVASQAVREALDTEGVVEVHSRLDYPPGPPREKKLERDTSP
jgi:hypothetical protein